MTRVKYNTTLQEALLHKTKAHAKAKGLGGANDIIEEALELYFQLQGHQLWEKELGDGKYQVVTIHDNRMTLDYVNKRISIDTVTDTNVLLTDGYYCTLEL